MKMDKIIKQAQRMQAQMALAEITGDEVEEKLLDEVFGRFCVGK